MGVAAGPRAPSPPEPEFAGKREELNAVLDESLEFYRAGEIVKGAHRLQDFQDAIFRSE